MVLTQEIQKVELKQKIIMPYDIERLYKDAEEITSEAFALKIKSYDDSDTANLLAGRINKGRKRIDEVRKSMTADAVSFKRTVDNLFKPITKICDDALSYLDRQRSQFRQAERKRLAEEQAKAAAEEERRQRISMAKGGDGSNIKPVEQPVNKLEVRSTDAVRRIPDRDKIQAAILNAAEKVNIKFPLNIPGVEIYAEWKFNIFDSAGVPEEYKKDSFVDR